MEHEQHKKSIRECDDNIKIHSFATMSKVLKSFCHKIKTLRIDYNHIDRDQRHNVTVQVNELCAKYLIEFDMINIEANELAGMQNPFEIVEKVLVMGSQEKMQSEHLTLDQLFPKVRIMELCLDTVNDVNGINSTMPNLEHVSISHYPLRPIDYLTLWKISNFLKINPQIRVLNLQPPLMPMLGLASEYLPNLNVLKFETSVSENYTEHEAKEDDKNEDDNDGNVHFDNVNILHVIAISNQTLNFLSFKQLKQFELHCFADLSPWISYIIKNLQQLQKFYLSNGILNANDTKSLTGQLPFLSEFNATFDLNVDAETILKFVNGCKRLKRIHMQISNGIFDELITKLESNDWTKSNETIDMDTLSSKRISYER